jgi:methylated-DNA-[protein]-cysteine S-methyltransferase
MRNSNEESAARRAIEEAAKGLDFERLTREATARAEREGLVEVAYAELDSPFGRLLVAGTERGVVKLALPNQDSELVLRELAAMVSPRVLEAPARLDEARRELEAYFEGDLRHFQVPVDWRLARGFTDKVLHVVARIPYGETLSYGEVAAEAGNPRAFRAAGTACGHNPVPLIVPCHRVVQAGGQPGNYGGGPEMKRGLLELEGSLARKTGS